MQIPRLVRIAGVVLVLAIAPGCASSADHVAEGSAPAESASVPACESTDATEAFSNDMSLDSGGEPTPVEAAVEFGKIGDQLGYEFPAEEWKKVTDGAVSEGGDRPAVTLVADHVYLDIVQLNDDTWAVSGGGKCAS